MDCNINLLRGARGILPYCMVTYGNPETASLNAGYLDENNIPFDAPYEDWAYRDRHRSDFDVIPPDSIPPFIDSPCDFDPLYDLPSRPMAVPGSQRNLERYLQWKFEPYARIWNGLRDINGQIATVAPELSSLAWWEDCEDAAEVGSSDSTICDPFVQPEVRVFRQDGSNHVYLFYVNRQCRQLDNPIHVSLDDTGIPGGYVSHAVLDHSRRFIIPVSSIRHTFFFDDTLEAGQARLVEFVNVMDLDADLRITAPDVFARYPMAGVDIRDMEFTAGDTILVMADFYNMGTDSLEDVVVSCIDLSNDSVEIGRDTLGFAGLPTSGWTTDSDRAVFRWATGPSDIGVHILEISTAGRSPESATRRTMRLGPSSGSSHGIMRAPY